GEGRGKLLAIKEQKAILRRQNWRSRRVRRSILDQRQNGLTGVSSECTNVNKPDDFWVISGRTDHHAPVRMAHEEHRAVLRINGPFLSRNVIRKCVCGFLAACNFIPLFREKFVDASPPSPTQKTAVNENDISYSCRFACLFHKILSCTEHHCHD